ncbi:MAG: DUF4249 domain-containing protein [Chitinophagaceae bacterium]|nr:DUF4249 domain-containing protein [Chitinophagaceae bacterium]
MLKKHNWLFIALLAFIWVSCEKEIDIDLSSGEKLIVVEGSIETDQQPYVSITNSIGFFDKIDLSNIGYIKGADVQVTDLTAGKTIKLIEYNIDTTIGNQTFSFSIYGPDINDPQALNFKGQIGHTYLLNILSEGKNYTAVAQIPSTTGLDSIWTEPVPGREDTFSVLKALYNDPDTFGNSVRVQTLNRKYIKDGSFETFQTSFNSVYNDDIINGARFPLTLDLGYDKSKQYSNEEFQTIGYLRKGDTVTVKWGAIDRGVFKFWETLAFSAGSVGNPFASPTKIQSNVSGALGVWGAYNSLFYTITDTLK